MEIYNFKGFYGEYGQIKVNKCGSATLEIICSGKVYRKKYNSLKGAKIALGKFSDSYTITKYNSEV